MKKIIFILITFFITYNVKAIENLDINFNILENGNVEVIETYELKETTDFTRNLYYQLFTENNENLEETILYNFSYISEIEILDKTNNIQLVKDKDYTVLENKEGFNYLINNIKNFEIKYILENITVIHNDTAEVYYKIFNEDIKIENININIKNDFETNIYVKGNNINKNNNEYNIKNQQESLTLRIIFDKKNIKNTYNLDHTNLNVLDTLKEIDDSYIYHKEKNYIIFIIPMLLLIPIIIIFKRIITK